MGDLDNWMDENFIKGAFGTAMGDQVSVKIIRDRQSGYVLSLQPLQTVPSLSLLRSATITTL